MSTSNLKAHYAAEFFDTEEGRMERGVAAYLSADVRTKVPPTSNVGIAIQSLVKASAQFLLASNLDPIVRGEFYSVVRKQADVLHFG